jgi:hypothetical protein
MAENTAGHSSLSMPRQRPVKLYLHPSWHSVQAQGQLAFMRDDFWYYGLLWAHILNGHLMFPCQDSATMLSFPIWVHWNLFYLFTLTFPEQEEYQTWSTTSPTPPYGISAGSWHFLCFPYTQPHVNSFSKEYFITIWKG